MLQATDLLKKSKILQSNLQPNLQVNHLNLLHNRGLTILPILKLDLGILNHLQPRQVPSKTSRPDKRTILTTSLDLKGRISNHITLSNMPPSRKTHLPITLRQNNPSEVTPTLAKEDLTLIISLELSRITSSLRRSLKHSPSQDLSIQFNQCSQCSQCNLQNRRRKRQRRELSTSCSV